MNIKDLEKLNSAVAVLIQRSDFKETIERLSEEIESSSEPFVWGVVDTRVMDGELPALINSCWIFVLRRNVPSGCHYHPNSVQHMVVIKGHGNSRVGTETRRMVRFDNPDASLQEKWYIIAEGVPHEFFPEDEDMIVVSFHTAAADELEEVTFGTGESRRYHG